MPLKVIVFIVCFGTTLSTVQGFFKSDYTPQQVDVAMSKVSPGKDEVRIEDSAWKGEVLFAGKLSFSKTDRKNPTVREVYLPLVDEQRVFDEKPPVKVLASPTIPDGVKLDQIESHPVLKTFSPWEFRGCLQTFDDTDAVKELITAGYAPQLPLLVQRPCDLQSAKTELHWLHGIALLITLYGLFKFALAWRTAFVSRKAIMDHPLSEIMPKAATLSEAVRTAKTGYSTWRLFRESFLDAAQSFYPRLIVLRLKESMPLELAKESTGIFKEFLLAYRRNEARAFCTEKFAEPPFKLTAIAALLSFLALLAFPILGPDMIALPLFIGMGLLIVLIKRWYALTIKKAFYVVGGTAVLISALLVFVQTEIVERGFLFSIPYLLESPSLLKPQVFTYPHLAWFSLLMLPISAFTFRKVLDYFTVGATIDVGGRTEKVLHTENTEAPKRPGLTKDAVLIVVFLALTSLYYSYLSSAAEKAYQFAQAECLRVVADENPYDLSRSEAEIKRIGEIGCDKATALAAINSGETVDPVLRALTEHDDPELPIFLMIFFAALYLLLGNLPRRILSRIKGKKLS